MEREIPKAPTAHELWQIAKNEQLLNMCRLRKELMDLCIAAAEKGEMSMLYEQHIDKQTAEWLKNRGFELTPSGMYYGTYISWKGAEVPNDKCIGYSYSISKE